MAHYIQHKSPFTKTWCGPSAHAAVSTCVRHTRDEQEHWSSPRHLDGCWFAQPRFATPASPSRLTVGGRATGIFFLPPFQTLQRGNP